VQRNQTDPARRDDCLARRNAPLKSPLWGLAALEQKEVGVWIEEKKGFGLDEGIF
jgi:hypothetical protein